MSLKAKLVRMPEDLADKIQSYAELDNRSFNKQVIQILQEYIRARSKQDQPDIDTINGENSDDGLHGRDRY